MSDYYSILGIDRSASAEDIKRAYRKMANTHHPDKGGDTTQFQKIQEAYDTLGDPQKRAQYDTPQPSHQGFGDFAGGHPFNDFFAHFGGGFGPFGDIFGQRAPRNRTINLQTTITLEDAFFGKDLVANVTLPSGKDQIINVKIPAGIQSGTTLRLAGMGEDTMPGAPKGDIHLTVHVSDHSKFRREGDDLYTEVTMPVWSAILGDRIMVETIDKKNLEVTVPPGTQFDHILAVQGAGMPHMADNRFKGRMLIKLKLTIPTTLTESQKSSIKKLIS